jgi:phosphoribosylformylglycinamidine (FGAM) synthase-like amidotransferase family enzyme
VSRPLACVVSGYGINADEELALAFGMAGADARRVHAGDLVADPRLLAGFDIFALPGGFSFGDHLGSGKVLAHLFRRSLRSALEEFVDGGGLVIGICNGFQVLVKMGLLSNLAARWEPEVSLVHNESGVFEDRWVRIAFDSESPCVWTRGLASMEVPVRHGEGRFVVAGDRVLADLRAGHLVAARYAPREGGPGPARYPDNPNGSVDGIAGITDRTGRIFGLMPHPEAFLFRENHPEWTRGHGLPQRFALREPWGWPKVGPWAAATQRAAGARDMDVERPTRAGRARRSGGEGDGLAIFRGGVEAARASRRAPR